jgi:hypothetical protein
MLRFAEKFFVKNSSGSYVRSRGFYFCVPNTKKKRFVFDSHLGDPFSIFSASYAFMTTCVISVYCRVEVILASCCFAKIVPPVVSAVPIDVINYFFWPTACDQQKNNSVQIVTFNTVRHRETNAAIAAEIISSGNASYRCALRTAYFPSHYTCFWVVVELASYKFCGEVIARASSTCSNALSHSILQRSGWLEAGQGVGSAFLPRYSIGAVNAQ